MSMYLAKFFHRPPGSDDRELLLIPASGCSDEDRPMIIGIMMRPSGDEFMRKAYPSMTDAAAAYRRAANELIRDGYFETDHTNYTLRSLLPDPQRKPEWQQGLDELMLSALADNLEVQAKRIEALAVPPTAREPLYLWLAAHHRAADDPLDDATLALAQSACDAVVSLKAGKRPFYAWSIWPPEIEARIFELMHRIHLGRGEVASALEAIEQAREIADSQDRCVSHSLLLVEHYPERREEAFDQAFRYAQFGGFEEITERPDYADYLQRRKRKTKSDKGWRWSTKKEPANDAELHEVELLLGRELPKDYRAFLKKRGKSELLIRFQEESADLRFYGPSQLAEQRTNFVNYVTRTPEGMEDWFRKEYGVSLRDLVPIAEPANVSSCILLHLEPGDRFGWCYQWSHDDAGILEAAQPSFDEAMNAFTKGVEARNRETLFFLEIFPDD